MRKSYRVSFPNHAGDTLVGVLDTCDHPRFYAIFSHCFTCSKDLKAIVRISRVLAEGGIAVLRYDYTGLGDSHGEFQQTNFTTTCLDTICAAELAIRWVGRRRIKWRSGLTRPERLSQLPHPVVRPTCRII